MRRPRPPRPGLTPLLLLVGTACGGGEEATPESPGARSAALAATELSPAALEELGATGRARGFDLIVVTLDTVRADRFGCTGDTDAATPTIDGLAGNGVRFEHAFAPAPITLPSHATLFTGLDVPNHGVRNNGTFALGAARTTLAEVLRGAGYRTAAFIGAYVLDERYGLAQGFEHYDDEVDPTGTTRDSGHFNERNATRVTSAAVAWLERELPQAGDTPVFAWVHYFDAHHPYEPPGRFGRDFRGRPYDGEIAYVDSELARLVAAVEGAGRAERTLFVITSDHGEGLGEHAEDTHSRLLYDSTLRVPLILSARSLFPEPVVVRDRVVGLVDLFPSLLDLLGLDVPGAIDGRALFDGELDDDRALYVETLVPLFNHGWAPLHGLHRLGDKFISAPRPEFYDVVADPGELTNLYPDSPPGAEELEGKLRLFLRGQPSPFELRSTEQGLDPEQAKRLAALGYVRSAPVTGPVGTLDPKDMMPSLQLLMQARSLSDAGRHAEAQAKLGDLLEQNPGDAFAWETASLIHVRAGRHREAEEALRRMLEIQPTAEGHVRLAQLALQRQDLSTMQDNLLLAEALDPKEGGVHMVAGDAYATTGRFREAREAFERALAVDPIKWGAMARAKLDQLRALGH